MAGGSSAPVGGGRGQGITSYGTANKDTPMMEFNSANKAYE